MLFALILGIAWMTLYTIKIRLLVQAKSEIILAVWVLLTNIVWGYIIRAISLDEKTILVFAIGTALGAVLARRIDKSRDWYGNQPPAGSDKNGKVPKET